MTYWLQVSRSTSWAKEAYIYPWFFFCAINTLPKIQGAKIYKVFKFKRTIFFCKKYRWVPLQKGLQIYKILMLNKIFLQKKSTGLKPADFPKKLYLFYFKIPLLFRPKRLF